MFTCKQSSEVLWKFKLIQLQGVEKIIIGIN